MTINLTLFFQLLHFLCAYLLIDRLLLRKVVSIITEEQLAQEQLMKAIACERQEVAQKELLKNEQWLAYQEDFLKHAPTRETHVPSSPDSLNLTPELDAALQKELQHMLVAAIEKQVNTHE
jgi:hypothetical protein